MALFLFFVVQKLLTFAVLQLKLIGLAVKKSSLVEEPDVLLSAVDL